ncbi:hypothetical protein [Staphylococcus massiliensis]|uniref:DeoR-like transcriptional repressor C-terminal sensor domain-containing protein n=1 Tax=Staphylococcus massiliensis S46 TaxID=1229783 RepID=K9AJZ6_9STAP|nr:hypothetical protein [Staphylococcus massiliensis]EKU46351.1 hypothetical protein C273_09569 [Staphylococcus massiliensis S46]MCG3398668.1 hypothetical protein [Staphylococcus massiliensis]MCG3401230.1 hypothetical protein [Staphylococcus massiliensis]MCG3412593.1 hypothetical protein [Staphylococcus massiliensis]POA01034.1 hypothetical protein CD133_02775 [Staphylococcus massiliensis CCUG 55927]
MENISQINIKDVIEKFGNGDIIALDYHPSCLEVIDEISNQNKEVSILSASTHVMAYVAKHSKLDIIIPDGVVNREAGYIHDITQNRHLNNIEITAYFKNVSCTSNCDNSKGEDSVYADIQAYLSKQAKDIYLLNSNDIKTNSK